MRYVQTAVSKQPLVVRNTTHATLVMQLLATLSKEVDTTND